MSRRKPIKQTGTAKASLPLLSPDSRWENAPGVPPARGAGAPAEPGSQGSPFGFREKAALMAVFALLVFVAYAPAIKGGYIWDDDKYVTNNPLVNSDHGLWGIWFQPRRSPQYYPLVFTSFWVEARLWGLSHSATTSSMYCSIC